MAKSMVALLFLVTAAFVGCSTESPVEPMTDASVGAEFDESAIFGDQTEDLSYDGGVAKFRGHYCKAVTFTVRIENVSTGMTLKLSNGETAPVPIAPGVWTTTRIFNPLFRVGRPDLGIGMEQLAEDGDPSMLASNMESRWWVKSSGVFNTPVGNAGPAPAFPGDAYEFTFTAKPGQYLSLATMFVQSNDLFYSPGRVGVPLFRWGGVPVSGDITNFFKLWDAGTEVNQEPGLGADQAPRQAGPNTGATEHKRVRKVRDGYVYPATGEVIKVTITPMEAVS